jgi:hypothetical protein
VKIDTLSLPDAISRPALAKLLGVCPQTLKRAEKAKRLVGNKINSRTILYLKGDVLRLAAFTKPRTEGWI